MEVYLHTHSIVCKKLLRGRDSTLQKKALRIILTSLFAVTLVLVSVFATTNSTQAHAASVNPVQAGNSPTEPGWVGRANPYVHVVNYVAYIDRTIAKHLSASDVAMVKSSVHYYNSLPLKTRQFHGTLQLSTKSLHSQAVTPNSACNWNLYIAGTSWTGAVTIHLSYCLALEAGLGIGVDALIASAIAAIFPPAAPVGYLIGIYLGADALALATYASECGNAGVYFNFMLWNPAIFWPSRAC
jgi:hypothetical protein